MLSFGGSASTGCISSIWRANLSAEKFIILNKILIYSTYNTIQYCWKCWYLILYVNNFHKIFRLCFQAKHSPGIMVLNSHLAQLNSPTSILCAPQRCSKHTLHRENFLGHTKQSKPRPGSGMWHRSWRVLNNSFENLWTHPLLEHLQKKGVVLQMEP